MVFKYIFNLLVIHLWAKRTQTNVHCFGELAYSVRAYMCAICATIMALSVFSKNMAFMASNVVFKKHL